MKRLGLLACDSLWEPLRTEYGDYVDMFRAMFATIGAHVSLTVYPVHRGTLPHAVTECDAWLISGSRAGVYESLPWLAPLMDFVRAAHRAAVPQVGICFGHQLLAQALGGRAERAPHGWGLGNIPVTLLAGPDGLAPPGSPIRLHMAHQDQVVRLPPRAVHRATTAHCHYAMFTLDGCVLALQPHPEFSTGFMRAMTNDPQFSVEETLRSSALATYEAPADNAFAAGLIARFLELEHVNA